MLGVAVEVLKTVELVLGLVVVEVAGVVPAAEPEAAKIETSARLAKAAIATA